MKRTHLALCFLVLLTASAGCTGLFGPGSVDEEDLAENANTTEYDWNSDARATLNLSSDTYRSVYALDGRTIEVYTRDAFGRENPLDIEAVKFRYPNGTVVTVTETEAFRVERTREKTIIHTPTSGGKVAFVTTKSSRTVSTPVFLSTDGPEKPSYEVVLPPNTGVSVPLLSSVQPPGYETASVDGRTHVRWDSVETESLSIRYYLNRDLLIFGALAAVLTIAGILGAGYYLLQIRELERRRKDVGIDIETGDDQP